MAPAPPIPLISHAGLALPLAYRQGVAISAGQFLRDAVSLAARLPAHRHVLNLCEDRYHFAVGFAAALLRGQINLLPPNRTPEMLQQLASGFAGLYCLTVEAASVAALETLVYPADLGSGTCLAAVPLIAAGQVAAIAFTSGSTGQPTPHRKSWGALARSANAEASALAIEAGSGVTIIGTVPVQHMYGLESSMLLALANGLAFHARRPFYPEDIRATLAEVPAPRLLVTTPLHLRALLAESTALPPLALILSATAPLSDELALQAESRFGAPLREIYGCTETGMVAARRTVEGPLWRTLPGVTLRREDQTCWAQDGHVEAPAALADVIELTAPDTFLLHGRSADLVNIAGKRTSLASLNHHLNSIAGVLDGTFFIPSGDQADAAVTRLMAFVVAPTLTAQQLLAQLRQRIDAAFVPRPLHFVDALPRNATGKLPRAALDRLAKHLAQQQPQQCPQADQPLEQAP